MPISTDVTNLKVNVLTQAQYDTAVEAGTITANEISLITDGASQTIQVSVLPTASASELGKIYQYIGQTNQNYTNGYFYKCVDQSSGGYEISDLSFDSEEFVAPTCSLEDFSTWFFGFATDDEHPLNECTNVSFYQDDDGGEGELFWYAIPQNGEGDPGFGEWVGTPEQLEEAGFEFSDYCGYFNANFTITGGESSVSYTWQQVNVQPGSSPLYPSTMPILAGDAWEEDQETGELTQTLSNISEVTANNVVMVSPSPVSADLYAECGVLCIAQGNGTLTFKCDTLPDDDITVTVICF